MLPQRISFQPGVGRSIPSDLLRAMPGHWQLRELAGAYVNGNGRCLKVSSECRRPRAASALRCHPMGDRAAALILGEIERQYDSVSDRIFVTVDGREELAEIDPGTDQVAARYPLTGCKGSHGLLIDSENRLAFAACEENSKLVVFDLQSKKATATLSVGADPDVLAFDKAFGRLYVSAESGVISIFDERGKSLVKIGEGFFAASAHSVAVDQRTHRVYFPLQNVGGKPVLRIAVPTDKQL